MKYIIRLTDAPEEHMVLITLAEADVRKAAIDVVFDVVGVDKPEQLVASNVIAAGQIDDLKALQKSLFDRDANGIFIREGIDILANGKVLNPDAPMIDAFVPAELDGAKYQRCDLKIANPTAAGATRPSANPVEALSKVLFIHEIAAGPPIDVTKDYPELEDTLKWAEKEELVEIDVTKAAYKLSEKGVRLHDSYIAEAQELIKKYDIFGDVDVDSSGRARFDTGLGKDLRVPVFELEGVDPFRARFLLGLNDGEWDKLNNWIEVLKDRNWYQGIFEPIERAASVSDIGRDKLLSIIDQAKAALRDDYRLR
jgi:hypothetical protein